MFSIGQHSIEALRLEVRNIFDFPTNPIVFPNKSCLIFQTNPIVFSFLPCCFPCAVGPQNMRQEPGIIVNEALLTFFFEDVLNDALLKLFFGEFFKDALLKSFFGD